jgi:hypothetical protein
MSFLETRRPAAIEAGKENAMKVMGKAGTEKRLKLEKQHHKLLAAHARPEMRPHIHPRKKPRP